MRYPEITRKNRNTRKPSRALLSITILLMPTGRQGPNMMKTYPRIARPMTEKQDRVSRSVCQLCEMNQYGTDQSGGKGKACKNMRTLYILRSGEAMPIQLSLPPTSLSPFSEFVNMAFATAAVLHGRQSWRSVSSEWITARISTALQPSARSAILHRSRFRRSNSMWTIFVCRSKRCSSKELWKLKAEWRQDGIPDAQPRYSVSESGEGYIVTRAVSINGDVDDLPL